MEPNGEKRARSCPITERSSGQRYSGCGGEKRLLPQAGFQVMVHGFAKGSRFSLTETKSDCHDYIRVMRMRLVAEKN